MTLDSITKFRIVMFFLALHVLFSIASGAILVKENKEDSDNYRFGWVVIGYSLVWIILLLLASLGIYDVFLSDYNY
jgi:hypothetical protein